MTSERDPIVHGNKNSSEAYHPQLVPVSLSLALDDNRKIDLGVPISERLKDFRKYLPEVSDLEERIMPEDQRGLYAQSIKDYLDMVFTITPESRGPYKKMQEDGESYMSFTRGDFVYLYETSADSTSLTRITASDSSDDILYQGFAIEKGEILAIGAIAEGPSQDNFKTATIISSTPSSISFIREMFSDLSSMLQGI